MANTDRTREVERAMRASQAADDPFKIADAEYIEGHPSEYPPEVVAQAHQTVDAYWRREAGA